MEERYLGDSVYAEVQDGMIKLTTNNGYGANNVIFMDPTVFEALKKYYDDAVEYYRSNECA